LKESPFPYDEKGIVSGIDYPGRRYSHAVPTELRKALSAEIRMKMKKTVMAIERCVFGFG